MPLAVCLCGGPLCCRVYTRRVAVRCPERVREIVDSLAVAVVCRLSVGSVRAVDAEYGFVNVAFSVRARRCKQQKSEIGKKNKRVPKHDFS